MTCLDDAPLRHDIAVLLTFIHRVLRNESFKYLKVLTIWSLKYHQRTTFTAYMYESNKIKYKTHF